MYAIYLRLVTKEKVLILHQESASITETKEESELFVLNSEIQWIALDEVLACFTAF